MDRYKILSILASVTGADTEELNRLSGSAALSGIGLTSIEFIQFIVSIEEQFGIEVLDSDLVFSNFETLDHLFATLDKYFEQSAALKKVLITDCDNVLWHGIAGEEEIHIGTDEKSLQAELIKLYNAGVLLCLCSKNQPEIITEFFKNPDMLLNTEHFVISKIGYGDKPNSIREIAGELNLSTDSIVFIDDSDYEIGLVNAMLPEVTAVKVSYDDREFPEKIASFFAGTSSEINRTKQYRDQKEREKEKLRCASVAEYNASLGSCVKCDTAALGQADRLSELSMRTNQFNLSGKRYTADKISGLMRDSSYSIISLSASDKYGDMGIVALAVVCLGDPAVIESFFVSCRVFGRDFENILIDEVKKRYGNIAGVYRRTEKNARFENFYSANGVKISE